MIYKNPLILIFLILLSLTFESQAEKIKWRDKPEARYLPPFCGTNPKYAGIKLGFSSSHLNHYCKAKTTESNCFTQFGRAKKKCTDYLTKEYKYGMNYHKDPNNKLFPFLYQRNFPFLIESCGTTRIPKNDKDKVPMFRM